MNQKDKLKQCAVPVAHVITKEEVYYTTHS
jgi:hypothetical protein